MNLLRSVRARGADGCALIGTVSGSCSDTLPAFRLGNSEQEATVSSSLGELTDERLMLSYVDGNAAAFEALYRKYRGPVFRYLLHQCGNAGQAEELAQEVWLSVIKARSGYEPLAMFSTWLFRIARNRFIDHYRKNSRSAQDCPSSIDGDDEPWEEAVPAPAHETPHALLDRATVASRISQALEALPSVQREVFLLAEEGGMTLEEIAATTATPRETCKSRLRYALSKLRQSLGDCL